MEIIRGNFVWENGITDGNLIFEPNHNGKFLVQYI